MTYRVKLVVPCGDVHYFYATDLRAAKRMRGDLLQHLDGVQAACFIYVETPHGHVRIDEG